MSIMAPEVWGYVFFVVVFEFTGDICGYEISGLVWL